MKVDCAKLVPVPAQDDVSRFVIERLLAGIKVNVSVDGREHEGLIHNLDLAPGKSDHLFARVRVPDLDASIKVAIDIMGKVSVMPNQEEE